jgi:hypothetical protein
MPMSNQPKFDNPKLVVEHPELHHYTTGQGLTGILASKTIWATHFSDLNDSSEVKLLQAPLRQAVAARCKALVVEHQSKGISFMKRVQQLGGPQKVARDLAQSFVDSLYQITFDTDEEKRFGAPFIASFCSHAADQSYEREHGLLSQWRGYGRDGGYCMVFDTAKLIDFLSAEYSSFDYVHLNISAARYGDQNADISKLFPELVDRSEHFISEALKGNREPSGGEGLGEFLAGATLFKHRGFHEEREVRIAAMPGSKELQALMLLEDQKLQLRALKTISLPGEKSGRRHISLFEGFDVALPIKRVIVGPSHDQQGRATKVRELLPTNIPITMSETPFTG